ncbi:discoidin domain-containing protein, partial [bacterium]|nr:discoidin domain-containing protein [bacterium]
MDNRIRKTEALLVLLVIGLSCAKAQQRTIETFDEPTGWSYNIADGVSLNTSSEKGRTGNAIRIDYDFTEGTGYGGIQKFYAIDLPENYEFTFWLKAESPSNNFEIKFIDSTGNNVWWVNNRSFDFPREWTRVKVKRRHITFAWGPTEDRELKRIDRIEFTVASFVGGKGTLWLDDLRFEPLPPETDTWPQPSVSASSTAGKHFPALAADRMTDTFWQSKKGGQQRVTFDFRGRREFGGLQVRWLEGSHAKSYEVQLSADGKNWENAYSVGLNRSDISFIRLPETEAAYMRLILNAPSNGRNYGIREIVIPGVKSTLTPNDFIIYVAKNSPEGNYPAYFSERASYWTVTGVSSDTKEALLSEDGTVEVEKTRFSIEPMIKIGDTLINHSVVTPVQGMGFPGLNGGFVFLPSVEWEQSGIRFVTGVS